MAIDFDQVTTDDLLAGEDLPEVEDEEDTTVEEETVKEQPTEEQNTVEETVEETESTVEEEETTQEEKQQEVQSRVVDEIATQFGIEVGEDTPDSIEGINQVVREASNKMAEQQMSQIWKSFPDVREYAEFRVNGGDPDTFREQYLSSGGYSEMNVENLNHQKTLVREQMKMQGFDKEDIQAEINDLSDANLLENKAKRAKKYLTKQEQQKKQQLIEQQKQQAQHQRQQAQEQWNQIQNTIEQSSQFKGLKIPETEKSDFYKWMREPQSDGKTQREKQLQNVDLETQLMVDYLLYKGGNLSDLVDNLATTKNAKSLAERLQGNKKQTKSRQFNDGGGSTDPSNLESIDFALNN